MSDQRTVESKLERIEHTPGPWDIRQDIPYSTAGWVVFHGYHEENKTVCRLSHGSTVPPVHDKAYLENKANARLIAAVPDMKNALEKAHRFLSDYWQVLDEGCNSDLVEVNQLIEQALAKGEVAI